MQEYMESIQKINRDLKNNKIRNGLNKITNTF